MHVRVVFLWVSFISQRGSFCFVIFQIYKSLLLRLGLARQNGKDLLKTLQPACLTCFPCPGFFNLLPGCNAYSRGTGWGGEAEGLLSL